MFGSLFPSASLTSKSEGGDQTDGNSPVFGTWICLRFLGGGRLAPPPSLTDVTDEQAEKVSISVSLVGKMKCYMMTRNRKSDEKVCFCIGDGTMP